MAYDLQDQEQIAELKAFWDRYGNLLMWLVALGLAIFAGFRAWDWYKAEQAEDAAREYAGLQTAARDGKPEQVAERYQAILKAHAGTAYADMAALRQAEVQASAGKPDQAESALRQVVEKAVEPGFRQIAGLRLAGLLLDQKKHDDALKVLDQVKPAADDPFAGNVEDRRGDVLLAQGKIDEARAAFQAALKALPATAPLRQLVQAKLDQVGG